jgi:hypothetical protein
MNSIVTGDVIGTFTITTPHLQLLLFSKEPNSKRLFSSSIEPAIHTKPLNYGATMVFVPKDKIYHELTDFAQYCFELQPLSILPFL